MKAYQAKTVGAEVDIGRVARPMARHSPRRVLVLGDLRSDGSINQADIRLMAEPDPCK